MLTDEEAREIIRKKVHEEMEKEARERRDAFEKRLMKALKRYDRKEKGVIQKSS